MHVGVAREGRQCPHDPGVRGHPIGGDGEKAAGHSTLASHSRRGDLGTLRKKLQLAGFVKGPSAQTFVLAPYEQHRTMRRAAPKSWRAVQMMGFSGVETVEIPNLRRVDPKAGKIREEERRLLQDGVIRAFAELR